jgi:biotin/methionine sulfoxide reductase
MPSFAEFWARGHVELPCRHDYVHLADFRADPDAHPLKTGTGRVVLYSETLAGLAYPDCPPHAAWLPKAEWLGAGNARRFPFHLITAQPASRLHSQLDFGRVSSRAKAQGREVVMLNPADARRLGLLAGDTALISNDRGRCLAAVAITADVRERVAVLPTGAWLEEIDTAEGRLDIAGNPNVLTQDIAASAFSQGCAAQTCLVAITRYEGNAPAPAWAGVG